MLAKRGSGRSVGGKKGPSPAKGESPGGGGAPLEKAKSKKTLTQWHDGSSKKLSKKGAASLDFSKKSLDEDGRELTGGAAEEADEAARIAEVWFVRGGAGEEGGAR